MKFDTAAVRRCLKSFDFDTLFREHLGWDRYQASLAVTIDGQTFNLSAVAEKRGFVAYACESLPDRQVRLKIDHQVTKSAKEHFIIYADRAGGQQLWHWVRRETSKPTASRDHRFEASQSGDRLIQRLEQIAVSLDEEDSFTLIDATAAARAAFDVDRVTKRFYDQFKTEYAAFLTFIKGIKEEGDLQWYTSLMLNRLMFVYFIQKKGFLDGDTDYLRNRLQLVQEARGKDKFQSFYRYFLLSLFHKGLGQAPGDRTLDPTMGKLLGKVPYLNGGFFEVHQLEERNTGIDIPDQAFENLFAFFDRYSWHLDERELRADNEINPDVVGYIFEKYINQKQMGAYYTKEDITEYISKSTIIPFLFDAAEKKCSIAFQKGRFIWRLLSDAPDRYIYAAVRHGVVDEHGNVIPLPREIEKGVKDVSKRDGWNRSAPQPFALPTETWREHVSRRTRCLELRQKLRDGEVSSINDLVTLNLDLWQFARDAIVNAEGPEVTRAFWEAIEHVTVLDPTCGSGAFLFAALRILETLYSDCLECMERFVEDHAEKPHHPEQFTDFKKVLAQIEKHPNERYFVLKSIIIGNLFGVDIMEEAVEICKLRLFLKLVAQVETVRQIEPLPDIDFNIRAGNTLVGYATKQDARKAFTQSATGQGKLMLGDAEELYKRFEEGAETVERAFRQFRLEQTTRGGKVTSKDKQELRRRLADLDGELDRFLAAEYGVNPDKKVAFESWRASHQPFHWFVEFYGIMHGGGFDVIIGNPPFVEYPKVRTKYAVKGLRTEECGNLYGFVIEQGLRLVGRSGRIGIIAPISMISVSEAASVRAVARDGCKLLWYSSYAIRPAKLFEGVEQRLTICLGARRSDEAGSGRLFSTKYHQWYSDERATLLSRLSYVDITSIAGLDCVAKVPDPSMLEVLSRVSEHGDAHIGDYMSKSGKHSLFFHRTPGYWIRMMNFEPYFRSPTATRSVHHIRELHFTERRIERFAGCIGSSSLYFMWFFAVGNCRNLTMDDVAGFPVGRPTDRILDLCAKSFAELMVSYEQNSEIRKRGSTKFQEFNWVAAKPIVDQIDDLLAEHYGLTDIQLDFVKNYDIKIRVGADDDSDEE